MLEMQRSGIASHTQEMEVVALGIQWWDQLLMLRWKDTAMGLHV